MIAIIADDLTGAAELGAVALRFGLAAEVQTGELLASPADVVILNTDSRPLPPDQAARAAAAAAAAVRAAAEWVYKKVDSVLRGPVIAEIAAALPALRLDRALLVPTNPSLGRVIRDGRYYVQGRPLDETGFAADTDYPAATSDVLGLLGPSDELELAVLRQGRVVPARGIFVGQAETTADLAKWAGQVDSRTLPVGGAEFFAAVLAARGHSPAAAGAAEAPLSGGRLLVCGSSPPYARKTAELARARGVTVLPMPADVLSAAAPAAEAIGRWAQATCDALAGGAMAMVSIGHAEDRAVSPQMLTAHLAEVAAAILDRRAVSHVCVEGGATAWALVRRLGWTRLTVLRELAPGVASLKVCGQDGPAVTMKPGSYDWPADIWPAKR